MTRLENVASAYTIHNIFPRDRHAITQILYTHAKGTRIQVV